MQPDDNDLAPDEPASSSPTREVRHEYTLNWPRILTHLGASLVVSTYQAGKLVAAGVGPGGAGLELSYHNFERAMGVAVDRHRIAVGTQTAIWLLRDSPELAPRIEPAGTHDACFLTRSAQFTGEIQGHELAWSGDELWIVNTLFSCLCTLDDRHNFVPRWRPRFVTALAAEDRCHLNGLALAEGRPRYVTAMAESDSAQGWRATKASSGCLIDVDTNEVVVRGLAMPHSPRIYQGGVWLLDSGRGRLVTADLGRGSVETVVELPGYTRGLALMDRFAFVGLSKIRETSTFGGVPIAEKRGTLKCGVVIVDLAAGRQIGLLEFHSGIEEIFDVQLVAGVRNPVLSGPHPHLDGRPPIWTVPSPNRADSSEGGANRK